MAKPPDQRCPEADPRILYLLTNDVSSVLVRGQLSYLAAQGFDIHVGSGSEHGGVPRGFDASATVHSLPFKREPSLRHDIVAFLRTIRLIRRLRPTVVNASTPKAAVLGMLAAWLCRVPVRVLVIRGLRFETMSGLRRAIFRALDRLAAACANRILANSKSVLELAVQEGVVDCGVVLGAGSGNGIDLARFRGLNDTTRARANLGLSADGKVIGFVGRITKDKGVSDLLRAFDAVLEEQPDTNLLLVGPFESGDCLTERDERRIANDHRIVHRNEMSDPLEGFACIDVLAFPSYREGLPNVPLEAQACGIPVVAYASTGTVDAVQDRVGGRLIQVGNVDLLAGALVEILEDSEMRQALGSRGKNWVSCRFDQQALWQALGQCYWEWCGFRNPQEGVADCARLPG